MSRPHPLQMFAPNTSSLPSSTATSPSPSAPTPSSTPAPPALTGSPSQSASSSAPHPSYIQRHFKRRLQSSKQACDAELRKVIHAVTAYVEHSLRAQQEAEWEEEESRARDRESVMAVESTSDDAGDESDEEGRSATGSAGGGKRKKKVSTHRHRRSFLLSSGTKVVPPGTSPTAALMIPGSSSSSHPVPPPLTTQLPPTPTTLSAPSTSPVRVSVSASSSPTSTWSRASNPVTTARRASRYTRSPPLPPTLPTGTGSAPPALADLSRSSSRSRSRSPLPPATARPRSPTTLRTSTPPTTTTTAYSAPGAGLTGPDPSNPDFITTLLSLVSLSQQLVELPLSALTSPSSPHTLSQIVQSVQSLGRAWDLRPDWHGRGWYVQVLLAVASLSRVVEWWAAEREFWRFGEGEEGEEGEGEEGEVEGMTFVLRPAEAEQGEEGDGEGEREEDGGRGSGGESTDKERDRGEGERESTVVPEDRPPPPLRLPSHPLAGAQPIPTAPTPLAELTRPRPPPFQLAAAQKEKEKEQEGESKTKQTEDLRALADRALTEQVVMELGLDGERVLWVSPGWETIVGTPADSVVGRSLTPYLAPAEAHVFADATHHLQAEDPKTIEAKFLMFVSSAVPPLPPHSPQSPSSPLSPDSAGGMEGRYVEMEGKGMLVRDRGAGGEASHTLWLFRPCPNPSPVVETFARLPEAPPLHEEEREQEQELEYAPPPPTAGLTQSLTEPITPFAFDRPISTSTILCRICECQVPDWFFEKHNESCNEVHSLEAEISECDESVGELLGAIAGMLAAIDRLGQASPVTGQSASSSSSSSSSPSTGYTAPPPPPPPTPQAGGKDSPPEYRGVPLFTPASVPASPLQSGGLRTSASARLQRVAVRKLQRRLLEDLAEVLQTAREIEMPAVSEDAPNVPLERQPFLTPASEEKIALIRAWHAPATDDPALVRLVQDAETLMRTKVEQVNRMRNTLVHSERVRHEWESRVEQAFQQMEEDGSGSGSGEDGASGSGSGNEREGGSPDAGGAESSGVESGGALQATLTLPTPIAPSPVPFESQKSSLLPLPAPVPALATHSSILFSAHGPSSPSPPTTNSSNLSSPAHSVSPVLFSPPHAFSPLASSPMIPSPLAFTTPILPHHEDPAATDAAAASAPAPAQPPSMLQMTLGSPAPQQPPATLSIRRSPQQSLILPEPTVMVTPPLSPAMPISIPGSIALPPPMAASSSSNNKSSSKHSRRLSMGPNFSPTLSAAPLSPRIPSIAPASRTTPSSIRDFEIIKPISKGAFGSVYLAKKKSTGDYYAIKVLKKADMIAKNQVTNVKAERTILMQQSDSPFVVKLYFTFQNKDYLYLVMEYLNGGDCAALIKTIGALPEDWARTYVAEVILGLENIHARGIVHRDLKPDNLLIDSRGHLKLTDFGLSRIGLFGRQARDGRSFVQHRGSVASRARIPRSGFPSRQASMDSGVMSPGSDPALDTPSSYGTSYFTRGISTPHLASAVDDPSESSGSEGISVFHRGALASESPQQSFASELTSDLRLYHVGGGTPPGEQKFVGTPDYLAPETILATSEDDRAVDWWALGVITYEFLYGFPPFHAESPAQVFDNIISRRIEWYEEHIDYGREARDFMERLLCIDPAQRLGAKGAAEVKLHPWLKEVQWDSLTSKPAQFVPQITDPESTDYFDPRGAHLQLFQEDEPIASASSSPKADKMSLRPGSHHLENEPGLSPAMDDFGTFSYKNLPVLKQANDDVIRKLKAESPVGSLHGRRRSLSQRLQGKQTIITAFDPTKMGPTNPPSPSTSTSSIASTPSRGSFPPSTPSSGAPGHNRRPSEHGALERFKTQLDDGMRRNSISMPSRLRTASISSGGDQGSEAEVWQPMPMEVGTPATSVGSAEMGRRATESRADQTVICLLAEDNVISQKVQEILLTRLGCRCVLVADGYEAILAACNDIRFDCILMDYQMPILDGEVATKFIKGTNNKNNATPVIAVSAYTAADPAMNNDLFAAALSKPVQRDALIAVMKKLGFKIVTESAGTKHPHKVVLK